MTSDLASFLTKTDTELLAEARQGDREAFAEIVRRHEGAVRGFLTNYLFDSSIVDDLAQEVFLAVLTKIDRLEIPSSVKAWLVKAARNKAIDHLRKTSRRTMDSTVDIDKVVTDMQLERLTHDDVAADEADPLQKLATCLDRLRPAHRELIDEFYFEEMSAEAIAKSLGKSAGSVRMALCRIRRVLAKCIKTPNWRIESGASR